MTYAPEYYGNFVESAALAGGRPIIRITRGDSVTKSIPVTTDYTGYTGTMTIRHRSTDSVLASVSVSVASSTSLTAGFSTSDTAFSALSTAEDFGPHPFDVQLTNGSTVSTILGIAIIQIDHTRA